MSASKRKNSFLFFGVVLLTMACSVLPQNKTDNSASYAAHPTPEEDLRPLLIPGIRPNHDLSPRWASLPIRICSSNDLPDFVKKDLIEATKFWNKSVSKDVFDSNCVSEIPLKNYENESDHTVFWVKKNFKDYGDKTALARTLSLSVENKIVDADILLNAEFYNWKNKLLDRRSVLIHELGHVLGLVHNPLSPDSIMNNERYYLVGYKISKLAQVDLSIINTLYFNTPLQMPHYMQTYFLNGKEQALKELNTKSIESMTSNELYSLMALARINNLHSLAISAGVKYLLQNPSDYIASYFIGDSLWVIGQQQMATKLFDQALQFNKNYYEPMASKAIMLEQAGRKSEAITNLKKVLTIQPNHFEVCLKLYELTKENKYQKCYLEFSNN